MYDLLKITLLLPLAMCGCILTAAQSGADYKTLFEDGDQAYKRRDYSVAEEKLRLAQTAAVKPEETYAISIRLARIYMAQKKYDAAIAEARRVLAHARCGQKDKLSFQTLISEAFFRQDRFKKALDAADAALRGDASPSDPELYMRAVLLKAQSLLKLRRPQEALDALRTVAAGERHSVPTRAKYNYLAGFAAEQTGDLPAAQSHYRKNLEIDGKWFSQEAGRRLQILAAPRRNLLPDGSFEYSMGGAWNRMMTKECPAHGYLPEECPWQIDTENAFHGRRSLRSAGRGKPLLLQYEGEFANTVFSIYLKGEAGTPVRLEVYGYARFVPTRLAEKTVKLTGDWHRYSVKIPHKWLSVDKEAAPVDIRITPLDDRTVWADAAQLEKDGLTEYREYRSKLFTAEDGRREFEKRRIFKHVQPPSEAAAGPGGKLPKKRAFSVSCPVAAEDVSVTLGMPFAPGEWSGGGTITVESLRTGRRYPAQGVITGRWAQDRSVRAAAVTFLAPLAGGEEKFKLHFADAAPGTAAAGAEPPEISIFADAMDGTRFRGKELFRKVVASGELFTDEVRQGLLCDQTGAVLAMYSLHLRLNRRDSSVRLHSNILNMQPVAVAIRQAGVVIASGRAGEAAVYRQNYDHAKQSFLLPPDGGYSKVSAAGGTLLLREGSLRHPVKLEVNEKGDFTGYLWPPECRSLWLSRRMNLSREFIYTPDAGNADRHGFRAAALADAQDVVDSKFLMLPLSAPDEKTHPFAVKNFQELREKLLTAPDSILTHKTKIFHGLFNYGDVYGDRGWSNQESYMDFSGICFALLRHDPAVLEDALRRAQHYRDVDIVDGTASHHSPAHTSGPTYDFSHSWPQGVIYHYLLTGESRSLEVLEQVMERYLATPVDYKYISDSRSLGRFLLGLADFYALTGDPRLRERFFVQLERAERENLGPNFKDQTLFHWHGRCDPFHVWYGCCAFYQMYMLTGEEKLLKSFRREMDASLNMDFFRHDLNELWCGVPPEKAWPIQLGYHSHHRGSLFYPMMRFYAEKFDRPDYLKIAQLAAYAQFLRGDASRSEPMDIFRTAVLADADEKLLLAEALKLRREAAPGKGAVVNGDFSADDKWFRHWHVPANRQMSYDDVMESWPLPEVKDLPRITREYQKLEKFVSPWRGYARKFAYMDMREYGAAPPSLRVTAPGARVVDFESAPTVIEPGLWKFSGAFKCDENTDLRMTPFTFVYTEEQHKSRSYRIKPASPDGPAPVDLWHGSAILDDVQAAFLPGEKPGWRKFEFTFRNRAAGFITLKVFVRPRGGKAAATMWIDDVKLERKD